MTETGSVHGVCNVARCWSMFCSGVCDSGEYQCEDLNASLLGFRLHQCEEAHPFAHSVPTSKPGGLSVIPFG